MFYISKNAIYNQSLNTQHLHVMRDVGFKLTDVDFDVSTGDLYWARQASAVSPQTTKHFNIPPIILV